MKKNTNKKGFTIVELVIVVAVIAILAAVLIPTFSSIVEKANQSADQSDVRNMNVALATMTDSDVEYSEAVDALDEAGFNVKNGDMWQPLYKGYKAYWVKATNSIVLVKNNKVEFPKDSRYNNLDLTDETKVLEVKPGNYEAKSNATTAAAAVEDIKAAIGNGNSITLTETFAEPIEQAVTAIPADADVTVDLGGNTIKTTDRGDGQMAYGFNVYGDLVLTNAVIEARGVEVRDGGTMVLENVEVDSVGTTGGAAVYVYEGGEATINGGTYTNSAATNEIGTDAGLGATAVISYGNLTINGGTFTSTATVYAVCIYGGTASINNATITANRGGIMVSNATATITNCTVTSNWTSSAHALYVISSATAVVNGGTFSVPATNTNCYAILGSNNNVTLKNSPTIVGSQKLN